MKFKLVTLLLLFVTLGVNAQKTDRSQIPEPGPSPTINLGKTQEFKLNNGLQVIVVENKKLPRVSATLTIDNPPAVYGELKGAESMLGQMLGNGTAKLSKDEFNKRIDFLGANVYFSSSYAGFSSLSKYSDELFSLLADAVITPNFTEADFELEKSRAIEGIKSEEKDVETASNRAGKLIIYGEYHPYSQYVTVQDIEKTTLGQVQEFYTDYYRPNNAYLVIVGDVEFNNVKSLVTKLFSNWKPGTITSAKLPPIPKIDKSQIDIVNMPNAVQSILNISYPVKIDKNDPDYYAVRVLSNIFGGDFNSKLNMNLREAHGWTYGARGGVNDDKYIGNFFATAKVRNEVTDSAVFEALKEMKDITANKVDKELLEDVKAKFLGNFILSLERPQTVASQALTIKTDGLPSDFYEKYIERINAVTVEDVQRVAKKYIKPENAKIIVTGKGEQIYEGLSRLGYPVNFYDQYAKPITNPAEKQETSVTAQQVFDKYFEAIGGKEKALKVNTLFEKGVLKVMGQEADLIVKYASPNKSLMSFSIMGMEIKDVFDGETGYASQAGTKMPKDENDIKSARKSHSIFSPLGEDAKNAKVDGISDVDGEQAYKVVYTSETAVSKAEYYSVESGLLLKTEVISDKGGMISTHSGYTAFDGILFPTIISIQAGPQAMEIEIKEIIINSEVSDEDFK